MGIVPGVVIYVLKSRSDDISVEKNVKLEIVQRIILIKDQSCSSTKRKALHRGSAANH